MRFIKWYQPVDEDHSWFAWSGDARVWYEASKVDGGGWQLFYGEAGVNGRHRIGTSYPYLKDAKAAAADHYREPVRS